jgi:hypothetical protein
MKAHEIDVHVGARMRARREALGNEASSDEFRFDFGNGRGQAAGEESSDPLDLIWVVVGGTVSESLDDWLAARDAARHAEPDLDGGSPDATVTSLGAFSFSESLAAGDFYP